MEKDREGEDGRKEQGGKKEGGNREGVRAGDAAEDRILGMLPNSSCMNTATSFRDMLTILKWPWRYQQEQGEYRQTCAAHSQDGSSLTIPYLTGITVLR